MRRVLCVVLLACWSSLAGAASYPVQGPLAIDDAGTAQTLRSLATQLLHDQPATAGDAQRFRLLLMTGQYAEAERLLQAMQAGYRAQQNTGGEATAIFYRVYARASQVAGERKQSFEASLPQAFREVFGSLDNLAAALAVNAFGSPRDPYGPAVADARQGYATALAAEQGGQTLSGSDAQALIAAYLDVQSLQRMQAASVALVDEDDRRRYRIDDVLVDTPDGAHVNAIVVQPRQQARRTSLLGFTVYANPVWSMAEARLTAAHDYAGVVAYTRGMGRSTDQPVPYEHDGADADAVIEWISRQPWSDGRVGMYGGSYNGFTQWAAAKHRPAALQALMPSVTAAPGIDVPMEGHIFLNFVYAWIPYITRDRHLDQAYYDDRAHWSRLNRQWYLSGAAYRELDRIDGMPNPIFRRWLEHPSYDAYWQAMIPYQAEFAAIDIPVLTTTGYYDGAQIGALYYFRQHHQYNPHAEHYLVVGPYNHIGAQRSAWSTLDGYTIDPVANINIGKVLRYQWFDYVFRHGPKPALLADTVNYQVMGANVWKHAPSIEAMSNSRQRLYLDATAKGGDFSLSEQPSVHGPVAVQKLDFADRSDVDSDGPDLIIDKALDRRNALVFVGPVLTQATEVSGLFDGHLDLWLNKRDVDLSIALYEQLADGRYFRLSWYLARASYIKDRSQRHLLTPGVQHIDFQNGRLTSRLLQAGSRLVAVVGVVKQPSSQLNYGSGKDVSDETVADAGAPLELRWLGSSYLDIPIMR